MLSNTGNPKKLGKDRGPLHWSCRSLHIAVLGFHSGSIHPRAWCGQQMQVSTSLPDGFQALQWAHGVPSSRRSLPRDAGIVSKGEIITGMDSAVVSEKVGRKRVCVREASVLS